MKNSQRIVRRGEYYEFEASEDLISQKAPKKEEPASGNNGNSLLPSENITVDLPSFAAARNQYYFASSNGYSAKGVDEIKEELHSMLEEARLREEDKEEIGKLLKQIKLLQETGVWPLNSLPQTQAKIIPAHPDKRIELTSDLSLEDLQSKLSRLEKCSYAELNKLEHQLEVLLGQKKFVPPVPNQINEKVKAEIEDLYNHLSSLSCANNLTETVYRVYHNDSKHVEMMKWMARMADIIEMNADFASELAEDEKMLDKLEENFKRNIANAKKTLDTCRQTKK